MNFNDEEAQQVARANAHRPSFFVHDSHGRQSVLALGERGSSLTLAKKTMPQQWVDFIEAHFAPLWLLCFSWVVVAFTFKYFWHRSKGRFFEDPPARDSLYSERFASGRSFKSWYTRLGGASNCLKVVLTGERLFVRPVFPFLILGPDFDLVHSIPLKNIISAIRTDGPFMKSVRIKFQMTDGKLREIEIVSKRPDQLEGAISALIGVSNENGG